jgi:hypothetical protein
MWSSRELWLMTFSIQTIAIVSAFVKLQSEELTDQL